MSRSWPPTSTSLCWSPGLDNDFNLRRIGRPISRSACRARSRRWSCSTRRTLPMMSTGGWSRSTRSRGVATVAVWRGPARGSTSCGRSAARDDRSDPRLVGGRQVTWSTRCSARTARPTAEVPMPTRAAGTRRPSASCSSCPVGALVDTPGIRALEVLGAEEGVETAFDDVADIAAACRFSDCRHNGEPGCAVRAALEDGTLSPGTTKASHQKLEREIARAAREGDPRARAERVPAAPGRSSTGA